MRRMPNFSQKEIKDLKKFSDLAKNYYMTNAQDFDFSDPNPVFESNIYGIKKVILPKRFIDQHNVTVNTADYMFAGTDIEAVATLSDNLISTRNMFGNQTSLVLELKYFDTSKVTNMNFMFSSSQVLNLDLSNFDTSKVTDMSYMFEGSQVLNLDLSNFTNESITNKVQMFKSCSNDLVVHFKNEAMADYFTDGTFWPAGATAMVGGKIYVPNV